MTKWVYIVCIEAFSGEGQTWGRRSEKKTQEVEMSQRNNVLSQKGLFYGMFFSLSSNEQDIGNMSAGFDLIFVTIDHCNVLIFL